MPTLFEVTPLPTGYAHPPKVSYSFQVFAEGVVTPSKKIITVCPTIERLGVTEMVDSLTTYTGEFTVQRSLDQAFLLSRANWVCLGVDYGTGLFRILPFNLAAGGVFQFNITQGAGASNPTEPATATAHVTLEGVAANREVIVLEKDGSGVWAVVGHGMSGLTGTVALELEVTTGAYYALGLDDFGVEFAPNLVVGVGTRIRPTSFVGFLYEITEAGTLPATEPEWWAIVGENPSRALGTARAIAVRYFQPIGHGPFPVEML